MSQGAIGMADQAKVFEGQVAVVTGAGTGIGRATALALACRGAALLLVGRRSDPLREVAGRCRTGSRAEWLSADLSAADAAAAVTDAVRERYGRVDVVVHAAGALTYGTVEFTDVDELDRLYRTNVRGPYALTRSLLPLLRRSPGQVVFVNSTAGLAAAAGFGAYAATKHALKGLADSLREELNAGGIRVVSVYPGRTATAMQDELHRAEGKRYLPDVLLQPEDVASVLVQALAMPRTAEVTDVRIRPMRSPTPGDRGVAGGANAEVGQ